MKIIATINAGEFILQATKEEIAQLHGFDRAYTVPENRAGTMFRVGDSVPVGKIYSAACSLHKYQAKELEAAQTAVDHIQDAITRAKNVFGPYTE